MRGRIHSRQLGGTACGHRAPRVGGPIERGIVNDDGHAVACEVDIELEAVGAMRQPVLEGDQRVLRCQLGAAAMREYQRMGRPEWRAGRTNAAGHES